jgi:hypothetical protein
MIYREIIPKIKELAKKYPIIVITGPRQSGKTTLVKEVFKKADYFNLESPDILEMVRSDPKGFLDEQKGQVIIDEIQKFPKLVSYLQVKVDKNKKPGQFILTGSQNFKLTELVSQSLAGRAAYFNLLGLTFSELKSSNLAYKDYLNQIINGFYPGKYDKKIKSSDFYNDYLATYIERDVRNIKNIGNLSNFQKFLRLLAGRVGQILNLSSLANDLGISYKTVDSWISILEASFIVFRLEPFYKNFNKRVIKNPKIYFYDVGLAAYLLRIDTKKELKNFYSHGMLFENMVIAELLKYVFNKRSTSSLYFFRNSTGYEIDCLVDMGLKLGLIEVKASQTFTKDFLKNIDILKKIIKGYRLKNYIVYNGKYNKIKDTKLISWKNISQLKRLF